MFFFGHNLRFSRDFFWKFQIFGNLKFRFFIWKFEKKKVSKKNNKIKDFATIKKNNCYISKDELLTPRNKKVVPLGNFREKYLFSPDPPKSERHNI